MLRMSDRDDLGDRGGSFGDRPRRDFGVRPRRDFGDRPRRDESETPATTEGNA